MNEPAPEIDTRVGSVLAGKYRLSRLLGTGGMGAVYEARNEWTERRVAIKVLHGTMARDAQATARFMREARAATRVAHPNIVEVLDMGEDPTDGSLYIVQEFLVGTDLRTHLNSRGPMPPREALECVMPVMGALIAAHRLGIVHRDIKPENIFLTKNSEGRRVPKLIDFGIAKVEGGESLGLTRTGAAMGTPYYMSPEQAAGERFIDAQTDVWAIGVVLFEMLSGECPFEGDNYNQLLARILTAPVPKLASVAPTVPLGLSLVVEGALQRKKPERYKSMTLFLDALIDAADFAGAEWQRSTRRWFDRQVGAFDEDGENPTSVMVPDDVGAEGLDRSLTPTPSSLDAARPKSSYDDSASGWAIKIPDLASADEGNDGAPKNLLSTPNSAPGGVTFPRESLANAPSPSPKNPLLVNTPNGSTLMGMTPAHGSPAIPVPAGVPADMSAAHYAPSLSAPPSVPSSAPATGSSRTLLYVGLVAIALALSGVAAVVALRPARPAVPTVTINTASTAPTAASARPSLVVPTATVFVTAAPTVATVIAAPSLLIAAPRWTPPATPSVVASAQPSGEPRASARPTAGASAERPSATPPRPRPTSVRVVRDYDEE